MNDNNNKIIATADDALLAKLATVKAGYYQDPFLEPFGRQAAGITGGPRRSRQVQPIIKRGTHARVCCMDRAISVFLNYRLTTSTTKQVIVLGCGKDTSYFRHDITEDIRWFEVDHPSVIQTKARIIQASPKIFASTIQRTSSGFSLSTNLPQQGETKKRKACQLIEHDLTASPQDLINKLQSTSQFDLQAPTLFLLECVLMYLPDEASQNLFHCLSQQFPRAVISCYEPILGTDPFGRVMEQNLAKAGVAPDGSCLRNTRTLEAQLDKLVTCGFQTAVGCDMASAYESVLTQEQRKRASQTEFLDELEEWLLIMRHYCFLVATTLSGEENEYFCGAGPNSALGFSGGKCQRKAKT